MILWVKYKTPTFQYTDSVIRAVSHCLCWYLPHRCCSKVTSKLTCFGISIHKWNAEETRASLGIGDAGRSYLPSSLNVSRFLKSRQTSKWFTRNSWTTSRCVYYQRCFILWQIHWKSLLNLKIASREKI